MAEEQSRQEPSGQPSSLGASWREVSEQLQELGAKLATAFRTAWTEERSAEQEEAARTLQDNLREAADKLERVVKRVATETEPERQAAVEATRGASEQVWAEARSVIVSGLRTLNRQIDALVERMEREQRDAQERQQAIGAGQAPPSAEPESRPRTLAGEEPEEPPRG